MAKKDDLIARAEELEIELDGSETIADLEALISEAEGSEEEEEEESSDDSEDEEEEEETTSKKSKKGKFQVFDSNGKAVKRVYEDEASAQEAAEIYGGRYREMK